MADAKESAIPSAEQLRLQMLEREMAEMEKREKAKRAAIQEHEEFAKTFLTQHVSEQERAVIQRLVRVAVEQGKTEALVYSFSSDLCSDGGRAINNALPEWPDTLQGKARELYERYVSVAKPQGYKLKAMIINFPGGVPGDVGFYLSWA
ncbi:MAG: hypothetical protein ABWZ57_17770 [Mesorhizobium sp.]